MNKHSRSLLRYLILLALPLAFYACTPAQPPHTKEPKEAKKTYKYTPAGPYYGVNDYITQLSLSKLVVTKTPGDAAALKPHLAIMADFANEKQTGGIYQPVVVLSYSEKRKKDVQQVIAPFVMAENNSGFPELVEITKQLDNKRYTLRDVHAYVLNSLPAGNLMPPTGNPDETRRAIDKTLAALLSNKTELADINEADVQLHLSQFFLQQRARDAAYLAADNARNALAEAEDNNRDPEIIRNLSNQLDLLNAQLRKEMPYTLNAL